MSALLRWSVSLLLLFFPQHSTLFSFCLIFLTAVSLLPYSLRARFHLPAYEQRTLVEGCLLNVWVNPRKSVTCYLICRTLLKSITKLLPDQAEVVVRVIFCVLFGILAYTGENLSQWAHSCISLWHVLPGLYP